MGGSVVGEGSNKRVKVHKCRYGRFERWGEAGGGGGEEEEKESEEAAVRFTVMFIFMFMTV